jgi:hypothetical protein
MHDQSQLDRTIESADPDRPLWGAAAIGAEINRSERQAHYLLERGLLDASKIGKFWVSTPRRLRDRLLGEVACRQTEPT